MQFPEIKGLLNRKKIKIFVQIFLTKMSLSALT